MPVRAGVYLRISQDRGGEAAGIERQRGECRELARSRGWVIAAEYIDNDVSAYDLRKTRPGWQRLLRDLAERQIDAVVAWHTDRLYRRVRDLLPLLEIADERGASLATVKSGDLDLSTGTGRMVASILASVSEGESALKSERLRAQRLQAAELGRPHGGPRVFGYTKDWLVVPEEATIVCAIADRLLSGDSLRAITNDLNARGVPTARGGVWRPSTVKQMITSARLSGGREHTPGGTGKRRRRGRGLGEVVAKGSWPPIISTEKTERLRLLLSDPSRSTTRAGARLLSSGVAVCGRCGQPLNSRTLAGDPSGWRYACIRMAGRQASHCGGITVVGQPVDALVTDEVLGLLAEPHGRPLVFGQENGRTTPTAAMHTEAEEMRHRTRQLAVDYTRGLLERAAYLAAQQAATARLVELHVDQVGVMIDPLAGLPRGRLALTEAWDRLHLDRRRAVIRAVVEQVVVHPVRRRGHPRFDPTRVEIIWRA